MEGDRPPQLRRYPSVLDMGKMIAVEYEGEAGFFHQSRSPSSPAATGIIWLVPTTMMLAGRRLEQVYEFRALRRILLSPEVIVRAVLGGQETEDTCREGAGPGLPEAMPPPATLDTPPRAQG